MSDDQLSHEERSVLDALEASLVADDPAFVDGFATEAQGLGRPRSSRWVAPLRWLQRRGRNQLGP
jgi:Protein of unknown function (DUF3040)